MHPFEVAQSVSDHGYTYTYWHLKNFWGKSRWSCLCLLWVARQYLRHMEGKTLLDRVLG